MERVIHRGVAAVETPHSARFHEANAGRAAVAAFHGALLFPLEVDLRADDLADCCDKLRSAANSSHGSENSFNVAIFGVMGEFIRRFAQSSFSPRRQRPTPWDRVVVKETAIILVWK
jgi:hypothetical protein